MCTHVAIYSESPYEETKKTLVWDIILCCLSGFKRTFSGFSMKVKENTSH